MKAIILPLFVLLVSFGPHQHAKEVSVCEALKQITAAMKSSKYVNLMEGTGNEGTFASKLDIQNWSEEQVYYEKGSSFRFTATFNSSRKEEVRSGYEEVKKNIAKCMKIEPEILTMSDGESAYFEIAENMRIELDFFATADGSWIDMNISRDY